MEFSNFISLQLFSMGNMKMVCLERKKNQKKRKKFDIRRFTLRIYNIIIDVADNT